MRKTPFVNNNLYHVFNRGVDKREIFSDEYDLQRFFQSMNEFNVIEPIGSIYANSFAKDPLRRPTSKLPKSGRLVDFVAFCLNPNHYHFILRQLVNGGISEFMKRLGGGYAKHYNEKYNRSGALFQGRFKSVHIDTNEYLLHVSAYVNLNDKVHNLSSFGDLASKLVKSSWEEYSVGESSTCVRSFCKKDIILGQFNRILDYKKFAISSLKDIQKRKEMGKFLLE